MERAMRISRRRNLGNLMKAHEPEGSTVSSSHLRSVGSRPVLSEGLPARRNQHLTSTHVRKVEHGGYRRMKCADWLRKELIVQLRKDSFTGARRRRDCDSRSAQIELNR